MPNSQTDITISFVILLLDVNQMALQDGGLLPDGRKEIYITFLVTTAEANEQQLYVYRIPGNFGSVKIFVIEMYDHGNIRKGQPFAKFIYIRIFTLTTITRVKMQE